MFNFLRRFAWWCKPTPAQDFITKEALRIAHEQSSFIIKVRERNRKVSNG